MVPIAAASAASIADLPVGVLEGVIAAAIVAVATAGWRLTSGWRQRRAQLERDLAAAQGQLGTLNVELARAGQRHKDDKESALVYMTHLRDVGQALARAGPATSRELAERVRREILEPIRGLYTRQSGEELRCVWFRLDETGQHLYMHSQVGHTLQRQRDLRLYLKKSIAGAAYIQAETINLPDLAADPRFEFLPGGDNEGSIICTPVFDANDDASGVLSVLSTRKNAFGDLETRYVEALAAAIGAFEALERPPESAD